MTATAEPEPNPRRRLPTPRPITHYLVILVLVALLPAFAFSAILLQRNNEAQERVVESLIIGTTRSIVQAVEREITANITTLRILATTPSLLDGNLEGFYTRVQMALGNTTTNLFVLDETLTTILSTRVPFPPQPQRTADPQSAQAAIERDGVVVSDVLLGAVSRQWVFNILMPVENDAGEQYVVALNQDAGELTTALLSSALPDGWNVVLIDSDATVIAASPDGGTTGETFALASATDLTTSFGWRIVERDGRAYRAVIQRSPLTGWTLFAWAPREVIERPLHEAVASLLIGGILLALAVILVCYWLGLRIGRSVRGLAHDAKRLGAGQKVTRHHYPIAEIDTVSGVIAEAGEQRQAAETEVRFLLRELAHRSKNQMTVIAAMAKQTAKGADNVPEFVQNFEKRIFGLARSTDLLLANGMIGVDLHELLSRQIDPFCPVEGKRVSLSGPAVRLNTQAAQIIGMGAHEMATNAVKYGAFSRDDGTLAVSWHRTGDIVSLVWRESVGTLAERPDRRGFGTTVLENMVGSALGAEVTRTLHTDGMEWRFDIPIEALDPSHSPHGAIEEEAGSSPA
ncbi:histidine kinase [Arsenicitalea aurantiaca]|uniref:histidine kinase n=1 Tax=Arsenicitalea aurantiaca TaxID=1783274 RepID=A0A433X850_9HYPH|nr:sensor histidine kinase [Arsenicitalea aurantiaca]RUT30239.1 histidine kinase [Arsenicitalea aurantiaca]